MPPQPSSLPGLPDDYVAKLFVGDIVTSFIRPHYRARVLRTWASDAELDLPPVPPGQERHPLDRQLLRGEVGLSELKTGILSIVPESSLLLFQREFLKGDVVKRSLTAVESAVIMDIKSEVQVEHCISLKRIRSWIPWEEFTSAMGVEVGDRVIYDNWVGIVHDSIEEAIVEKASDKTLYKRSEHAGPLDPGTQVGLSRGQALTSETMLAGFDVALRVRPLCIYVIWNAINQMLPIAEQDNHPEPQKLWQGDEMSKLTLCDMTNHEAPQLNNKMRFRDPAAAQKYGAVPSIHGIGGQQLAVDVYTIVESRSKLRLRWQDGTETEDWSTELVPYHNVDDYESWPGEHLTWVGDDGQSRPAVVQKFDPRQRVADLLFTDTDAGERATVPVLELDLGNQIQGKGSYGVTAGLYVLIGKDNGCEPPIVPTLGLTVPLDDDAMHGELDRRLALHDASGPVDLSEPALPSRDLSAVDWIGEVTELHLNGMTTVRLLNGEAKQFGLRQLTFLSEPPPPNEHGDHPDDPMDEPMDEEEFYDEDRPWVDDEGREVDNASQASWETIPPAYPPAGEDVDMADVEPHQVNSDNDDRVALRDDFDDDMSAKDADEVEPMITIDDEIARAPPEAEAPRPAVTEEPMARQSQPENAQAGPSTLPSGGSAANGHVKPSLAGDEDWTPFEVLETAPEDHHYYKEPRAGAMSRTYLSRLQKEHRALSTSLPENILVRTYEDRTDLMRVLIIGPEGTPYTDAPFVFDVFLNPSNFPHEPPLVHFHSHTNGKGRCNPNLYEEGKVCLSILGTWSGDKSESWSAQKSSLLQVFVSISGLVLVRSPYHCEPAFAKLEGTREGKVNSRLYSEKAYVLSRSFVRTALTRPPTGLEKELKHLYFTKSRLRSVIDHAKRLMDKGEAGTEAEGEEMAEMWNADAMGSLTLGAIISLKRTITALEKLEADHAAGVTSNSGVTSN